MGNSAVASAPAEAEARPSAPPAPIIDRTQGKIIANRYRLEDTILGTGAFAIVKLGIDLESKRHVAIRIVDKEKLSPVGLAYLKAECDLYKDLDHPSIVKCFLIKEGKKYVIFVTEYMPDGNLSNHFSKKAMVRELEAREIVDQILSALRYLHGRGITWRDLKSSNILLDMEKTAVKICDFGFAARMEPGKLFTDFPGTMAYSPPEVLSATPYEGAPRDVWSLGVFLYKMLTGKYPFGSRTNPNTRQRILEAEPEIDSLFISEPAKEILRGMLQKNPAQRFTLQAIQQSEWMTAPPASLAPKKRATMAPVIVPTTKKQPLVRQCSVDSGIGSVVQKERHPGGDGAEGFVMIPRNVTVIASPRTGAEHIVPPSASLSAPIRHNNTSPAPRDAHSDVARSRTATQPAPVSSPRSLQSPQKPFPASSPDAVPLAQQRSRTNTQPLPQPQSPRVQTTTQTQLQTHPHIAIQTQNPALSHMASSPPQPQQPLLHQPPQPPKPLAPSPLNSTSAANSPPSASAITATTSGTIVATSSGTITSAATTSTQIETGPKTPTATPVLIPDLPTPSFLQSAGDGPTLNATSVPSLPQASPSTIIDISKSPQSSDVPGALSQPFV